MECRNTKCPAYEECFAEFRGSLCAARRYSYGLDDPFTNADKIRSMTDEELAEFLEGDYGNMEPHTALKWLKQEVN